MSIDWNAFTPGASLAGGVLIGLAVALFVLLNGRIAGISGVLGGLLRPARGDVGWRIAFVLAWLPRRWRIRCLRPCRCRASARAGPPWWWPVCWWA